jgi:DNA-binding MarR family transcriptional regulator
LNTKRDASIAAVLAELTSGNPRERMFMFRKWLAGALSIVQLHVLTVLEASGPQPMGKLADQLDVSVASATGIVDRMEQRGLVERRHGVDDRRVILVHPTESGLKVFADLAEQRRLGMQAILDQLTDEELEALAVGLRAMGAARSRLAAEAMAAAEAAESGTVDSERDVTAADPREQPRGSR